MTISKKLLDILACPKCKSDVQINATEDKLTCVKCKEVYKIKDGIPVMMIGKEKL